MTTTGLSRSGSSDGGQDDVPERAVIGFPDSGFPNGYRVWNSSSNQ